MAEIPKIKRHSDISKENITYIFQKYYEDPNLSVLSLEKDKKDDEVGKHNLSDISTFSVKLSNLEEPLKILVKAPVQSFAQKMFSKSSKPFMKEAFWYMEAAPVLKKINPRLEDISPNCFYATTAHGQNYRQSWADEKGSAAKMLFNKTDSGITIMEYLDKTHLISPKKVHQANHAKLVLSALAEYHGSWITWMKNQDPPTMGNLSKDDLLKNISYPLVQESEVKFFTVILPGLENQLKALGKPEDLINAFHKFRKKDLSKLLNLCHYRVLQDKTWAVLVHGDCWTNNFLFNEDETKVTMIDFQLSHAAHLARDIWQYIYMSTDYNWRKKYLEECLKHYFDPFEKLLNQAGIKMTFEEFREEIEKFRGFGFMIGLGASCFVVDGEVDIQTFYGYFKALKARKERYSKTPGPDEHEDVVEANNRLLGVVEEAYDIGLFEMYKDL